ncbi:MAG: DNA polymerase IV [Nitrososphaerota archaeon]|nr:DNA polymerase IV [Nitrososphaerota archaeon]
MTRVIGHIDLDYFYAQVEEVEDPSLTQRPVIVCVFSGRTDDSGVVSTANYRAREFGVHSGMPIVQAKKRLEGKDPAVIKMDHGKYEAVSSRIMEALEEMVDILEPTGIDEAFFDITAATGGDYAEARKAAGTIKAAILESERLTSSMGIGRSKVVAKLGSDISKPNGLTVILPEHTEAFLNPLPANRLYGVGPKTSAILGEMGVATVAELAKMPPSELTKRFGRKFGGYLSAAASGTDADPVVRGLEPTQYSRIVTLKQDTKDPQEVLSQLEAGIEHVHSKLASTSKSFKTVTVIGILTDLSTKTRSRTFENPVENVAILRGATLELFQELSKSIGRDFRRAGVRVSGLAGLEGQRSLSEFVGSVK